MAIIFTSPKKRQRILFWSTMAFSVAAFIIVYLIAFPFQFGNNLQINPVEETFIAPDVRINFNLMDSAKVVSLDPFSEIDIEFSFVGQNKKNEKISGQISASSESDAKNLLEEMGFKVSSIKKVDVGRDEPFTPYYQLSNF